VLLSRAALPSHLAQLLDVPLHLVDPAAAPPPPPAADGWRAGYGDGGALPAVVAALVTRLEAVGLAAAHLFRVPAATADLADLQARLAVGGAPAAVLAEIDCPHTLACLLTRWLRDQDAPLLPPHLYRRCAAAADAAAGAGAGGMWAAATGAAAVVAALPVGRRAVLAALVAVTLRRGHTCTIALPNPAPCRIGTESSPCRTVDCH
jgi:hypothetical protein